MVEQGMAGKAGPGLAWYGLAQWGQVGHGRYGGAWSGRVTNSMAWQVRRG